MDFSRVTKFQWTLLLVNVIYLIIFGFLYFGRHNYEFLTYIGVITFFIILISFMHSRFNFTSGSLLGISLWGLMHMSGGYFIINSIRLYEHYILPFLRYDQFVHAFGFGFATLIVYQILKPNLSEEHKNIGIISVLVILIGMGLGTINEIVEYIMVVILPNTGVGGYENTMKDIVANTIGAFLAVLWINLGHKIPFLKSDV